MPFLDPLKQRIAAQTKAPEKRARILGISTKKKPRSFRVRSIAKRLTIRWEKQRFRKYRPDGSDESGRKPMRRKDRATNPRLKEIIAYDLETTRIKAGTPRPLYITAYGRDFHLSGLIKDIEHLADILKGRFLLPETKGCRFVAWNGNNFDVFFVAAALLYCPEFVIRPYLTKTKNLRGLKVISKQDARLSWEFLDGWAMTMGGQPTPLSKFLQTFAPDYLKLEAPNWETTEFDPLNPKHVAYAERDSEGLYHAMMRAQSIVLEHFHIGLQPTVGNLGIKIFQANMPAGIEVYEPPLPALRVIRDYVMRGGYCYTPGKYEGPIWKYDINQAYAAAMRDCNLPAGRCTWSKREHKYARCGVYRVSGTNPQNKVPFYYREIETGKSVFGIDGITETWLTSVEIAQLRAEGWELTIYEGYYFDDHFRMTDYVNRLEHLRIHGEGGPKGAQGIIMKCLGNNSYGKTVERLEGVDMLLSPTKPDGYSEYPTAHDDDETFAHVWFKFAKPLTREFHQPQLGAFITAHVRMVLRRAILVAPDAWLYSDTDCAFFSRPVPLPIDAGKYGYWKQEAAGEDYRIITKKVYASFGAEEKHCKGLNVKRLTDADFVAWYQGQPPRQKMTHRQNFIVAMQGAEMFVDRTRNGERKSHSKSVAENLRL